MTIRSIVQPARPSAKEILVLLLLTCTAGAYNQHSPVSPSDPTTTKVPTEEERQILSITYGTDPLALKWYTYNKEGDLARQAISMDTVVFTYHEQTIEKRHLNPAHSWHSKILYRVDPKGRIHRSTSYDEKGRKISSSEYYYDSLGYLHKTIEKVMASNNSTVHNYDYSNGNLIRETVSIGEKIVSHYSYTHHLDRKNNSNLFLQQISDDLFPNERLGKKNKNYVQQLANISADGDTLSLLQYSYPRSDQQDELLVVERDVLNEIETLLTYHFRPKENRK